MNNKLTAGLLGLVIAFTTFSGFNALAETKAISKEWVIQDKKVTPGALNKSVTQDNIKTTVCKSGWTATIRPTVTYTNKLKAEQLKTTYKSYIAIWGPEMSAYEEDHLISLQLGGDPSDSKNLWPEPYFGNGARKKDVAETALKRLVCDGTIKLANAQKMIATNWVAAYNKYVTKSDTPDNSDG
jgi:hypothetical protein